MTIDPIFGVLIGLAATVAIGFAGFWFAGVVERPEKPSPPTAAE